jgi:hypothetical protein
MTLPEYYNLKPTAIYPKTEFVDEILKACEEEFGEGCVSRATVINWCNGSTKPSDSKFIPILSKVTGIKEEDLFVW